MADYCNGKPVKPRPPRPGMTRGEFEVAFMAGMELKKKDDLILALAERVFLQSELLTKKAERP
jgi:hypothetical protein